MDHLATRQHRRCTCSCSRLADLAVQYERAFGPLMSLRRSVRRAVLADESRRGLIRRDLSDDDLRLLMGTEARP